MKNDFQSISSNKGRRLDTCWDRNVAKKAWQGTSPQKTEGVVQGRTGRQRQTRFIISKKTTTKFV